jgi:predicted O-methyltransferase YrrM
MDLEIPWITPEAVHSLFLFVKPYHTVLEFGAGGSTLFFAKRAKEVLSFETLPLWYNKMAEKLGSFSTNVELHLVSTIEECIKTIGPKKFDVILVDICDISRYDLAKMAIGMVNPGGIIVVDNYDAEYCFNLNSLFTEYKQGTYDDSHWAGKGTKIYYL